MKKLHIKSGTIFSDQSRNYEYEDTCDPAYIGPAIEKAKRFMRDSFDLERHRMFIEITEEWAQ